MSRKQKRIKFRYQASPIVGPLRQFVSVPNEVTHFKRIVGPLRPELVEHLVGICRNYRPQYEIFAKTDDTP